MHFCVVLIFRWKILTHKNRNFQYEKTLAVNKNQKLREKTENEKIKLSMSEKFRYYRLSIIFFISAIFCSTEGMTKLPFENFNLYENPIDKIGILTLLLCFGTCFYFTYNLKVKIIRFSYNKTAFLNHIRKTIESNENWKLIKKSNNYIIIETKGRPERNLVIWPNENYSFISPNSGNRIYIGIGYKYFFIKSLFNLSNESFFAIDNGESKRIEGIITKLIKSTANTLQN